MQAYRMITVDIKEDEIVAALDRLSRAMTDMSPAMAEVADFWSEATQERMREGKSPDGAAFAPRSQSTLDAYAKRGLTPGPHPLWLSGEMRESLHSGSGSDFAEIGSSAIQAAVMQFGAAQGAFGARIGRTRPSEKRPQAQDFFMTIPWGNIPARPFLGISQSDRTGIEEIVSEWLERVRDGQ